MSSINHNCLTSPSTCFTAADPFVFDFVDLENLYGNEIKKGDRIIISIRMGVMEIRKVITGGGGDLQ